MFHLPIAESTARGIYKNRAQFKRQAAADENLSWTRHRRSYFAKVSSKLWKWYQTLQRVGSKHLPVSGRILEARARLIAVELRVTGFKGSPNFIQKWARRYYLHNIALWGTGGSADASWAEPLIAETRKKLKGYSPERIDNVDETALFYRCIPNRAYETADQRRRARWTKAMKSKDRVTLVLARNATGTHKITIAIIGKAKQPLCFKRPRQPCPLPYFFQESAWMDGSVYKSWFETVFLPAVRDRTRLPVALISDNCGAHVELESDQVRFVPLPPNCTSLYQPLDLGIIACLKRRYKRRLLDLVVTAFESGRGSSGQPAAAGGGGNGAPASSTPVTAPVASAPSGASSEAAESTNSASGSAVAGHRSNSMADAAMAAGPGVWGFPSNWPAATPEEAAAARPVNRRRLPAHRALTRPVPGVRKGAGAHLQDAAEIALAQWAAIEPRTIVHCWIKSTLLPADVAAAVNAQHGEYSKSSHSVREDVEACVALMSGSEFGRAAFAGGGAAASAAALKGWLRQEEDEGARAATADDIVWAGKPAIEEEGSENGDSASSSSSGHE